MDATLIAGLDIPGMRPARQKRSRDLVAELMRAGLVLLKDRDFDRLSIADLCAATGTTVGSFYARFDSKEAYVRALQLGVVEESRRAMRRDYGRRWSIRDFAELMGLSETQFFRRFRTALGVSPMDYLRRERINNAKRALAGSSDPIHLIAERVGYGDPYYFSRDFKKVVGIPPRDYRRKEQM